MILLISVTLFALHPAAKIQLRFSVWITRRCFSVRHKRDLCVKFYTEVWSSV